MEVNYVLMIKMKKILNIYLLLKLGRELKRRKQGVLQV
jgi:hypothetical protein